MKIHSDILTMPNIDAAARKASASIIWETFDTAGSRSRKRSFLVHLSGSSPYKAGFAGNNGYKAATWDEWGMFLAELFTIDPAMHCGKNSYHSAAHFHWMTGSRFVGLTPSYQHRRHNWHPSPGWQDRKNWVEQWCDCGASHRWTYGDLDWRTVEKLAAV